MKIFKKAASILLAASCVLSALATSAAAASHPDPPKKLSVQLETIRSYSDAGFTDVANDWSLPVITTCYELGLMSGRGADKFAPSGTVSLAEAVTVSARIHELADGGDGVLPESTPWYQSAVDYALENKLISAGQFTDYTAAATRAELAGLLANVLPRADYAPINEISQLPDVNDKTPYSADIFKLYNAGVIAGSDVYGTFAPLSSITRAELSAMLCRLVQPGTRMAVDLKEKPEGPAVAYSSDKILWIDAYPVAGLVEINGELYCPVESMMRRNMMYWQFMDPPLGVYAFNGSLINNGVMYMAMDVYTKEKPAPVPVLSNFTRREVGIAEPTDIDLHIRYGSEWDRNAPSETVSKAVYVMAGEYYLIKLSALPEEFGYTVGGDGARIFQGKIEDYTVVHEDDLVGEALPGLLRSTTRETLKAIHDYLVNKMRYDMVKIGGSSTPERDAIMEEVCARYQSPLNKSLASGYGICSDYTYLFQAFCQRAGIPCEFVTGQTKGGMFSGWDDHAWNKVYVDGAWYYIDVTFDDPIGGKPRQTYFMIDAAALARDHKWNGADYPA